MTVSDQAIAYMQRKRAALYALVQHTAKQAEGDMRHGGPWKDRTGHARQRLHAGVDRSGDALIMYLAHGVRYGQYLETGTGIHGPIGAPYDIVAVNGDALFWPGAAHPVAAVRNHPGMKPHAVVQPTAHKYVPILRDAVLKLWGAEP